MFAACEWKLSGVDRKTYITADMSDITEQYSAAAITDDSCIIPYIEIVPLTRDADDPGTTECDGGDDWIVELKQDMLQEIKQEPDDVCYMLL